MELNSTMICDMLNEVYEQAKKDEEQENIDFIKNADIVICIKVSDNYDCYSLADRIEDILDDIPAVEDMTMFIK